MKQQLFILTLVFFMVSCREDNFSKLKKTWIPVGCVLENGEKHNTNFQSILTFENEIIRITNFGIEKDSTFHYSLNENNEIISIYWPEARIIELQDDLMVISFSEGKKIIFKPIYNNNKSQSINHALTRLKGREWEIFNKSVEKRIISFDSITRGADLLKPDISNVYSYDQFDLFENEIYHEFGFWTVKNVLGNILINIGDVYGYNEYRILLIEEIKDDHIICKNLNLNHEEKLILKEIPKLKGKDADFFNLKLTRSDWQISEYSKPDSIVGFSSSTYDYYESIDSTLLVSWKDFKSNNISYKFYKDNTFIRLIGEKQAISGEWNVLNNGEIIRLLEIWSGEKDGFEREKFLLVKSLKDNEFHFTTKESLYTEFGFYQDYFIEQKYKNSR
ncbi:MAG: hypothetical protein LPJ98_07635 [Cyclobacteriaceae bacterium]|nr:hypothetical protein [Cyclobacteriaceae bacterium]